MLARAKSLKFLATKEGKPEKPKRHSLVESFSKDSIASAVTLRFTNHTAPITKKIVCVGDGETGKTSMLTTFATGEYPSVINYVIQEYVPTIFENYVTQVEVENRLVNLSLWDTAGQEDYDRLRPLSYNGTDCVIVCYAIDRRGTFDNIKTRWIPEVKHYLPNCPIILVACKLDLRSNYIKRLHCISQQEGEALALEIGADAFLECSSKTRSGVNDVIEAATIKSLVQAPRLKRTTRCNYL